MILNKFAVYLYIDSKVSLKLLADKFPSYVNSLYYSFVIRKVYSESLVSLKVLNLVFPSLTSPP